MTTPLTVVRTRSGDAEGLNSALETLQTQDKMRYALEPTRKPHTDVTAAYNLLAEDWLVLADATGGAFTVTLPPAASVRNRAYVVKRLNSGGNAVTLDGNGSETIDGATTLPLTAQYQVATVYSDGTEWWVL